MVVAYHLRDKDIKTYYKTGDYNYLQKPKSKVNVKRKPKFRAKTSLGKYMSTKVQPGSNYVETLYEPACFVSEVTSNIDTLTEKLENGFAEMVPREIGKQIMDNKEKKINVPDQEPTGLFIGFSHVHWLTDTITPSGLRDYLEFLHSTYFPDETTGGVVDVRQLTGR